MSLLCDVISLDIVHVTSPAVITNDPFKIVNHDFFFIRKGFFMYLSADCSNYHFHLCFHPSLMIELFAVSDLLFVVTHQ